MTVGELIEKLAEYDPEIQVGIIDYQSGWRTLETVSEEVNVRKSGRTGSSRIGPTVELN